MDFEPKDQDVVEIVKQLKRTEQAYPRELMDARRQMYMSQMAGLGLTSGAGSLFRNPFKRGGGFTFHPIAGKVLEFALLVAIVAETGMLAYLNRDKLVVFLHPTTESISTTEITPEFLSPILLTGAEATEVTETAEPSQTPVPTANETPSATPVLNAAVSATTSIIDSVDESSPSGSGSAPTSASPASVSTSGGSTPVPNSDNTDNGNHYGQTPKPDRTKESNSGGTSSPNSDPTQGPKKNKNK